MAGELPFECIGGERVLELLKTDARTVHIPVIVVSGSVFESDRARLLDAGASDYLGKPLSCGELVVTARRHLDAAGPPLASRL